MKKSIKIINSLAITMCIIFIVIYLLSSFYILEEANHNCVGDTCQICVHIQEVENTLKQLSTGLMPITGGLLFISVYLKLLFYANSYKATSTLITLKVRLNN
ncbi:hypothetical protein [Metaclostridioides mangenotii]|jgi:hypothetical protein|uniref:hypothetical protein n=1 Tax=Metaclostridioides mangenotii TaxID=1540 RepID=UPI00068A63EE|nr:hypothetical protein [Clostridioides mangenotii]